MNQSFAVVTEKAAGNVSVHVPDLPGCVAMENTREQVLERIRDAIAFHLEGLEQDAQPAPAQRTSVATVMV